MPPEEPMSETKLRVETFAMREGNVAFVRAEVAAQMLAALRAAESNLYDVAHDLDCVSTDVLQQLRAAIAAASTSGGER